MSLLRFVTTCAAAAFAIAGCGSAIAPPAGSWLHPSFGAGQLEGETIVVLPVGAVSAAGAEVASDSVAASLALEAGEALATGLETGGAAGAAVRPVVAIVALGTLSREEVGSLYAPLSPDVLGADRSGRLDADEAARWRDVADRTGRRYFLLPRSLAVERIEPLRVRATFDAWLVDATSGTVLWQADVSAVNAHAPSGAATDVYGAALDDAIHAAVADLSMRLARLARSGSDDFEGAAP